MRYVDIGSDTGANDKAVDVVAIGGDVVWKQFYCLLTIDLPDATDTDLVPNGSLAIDAELGVLMIAKAGAWLTVTAA